jgi:hypothetical protein
VNRAGDAGPDVRTGGLQHLARTLVEEVHPDLRQDAERGDVDRLDLVIRQDRGRLIADARLLDRALLGQDVALMARSAAGPTTRRGRRRRIRQPGQILVDGRVEVVRHATAPWSPARRG